MKNMKRSVALLVAIALLIGCAAGGTIAWLMDKSEVVTNTFTTANINIELKEHEYEPSTNTLKGTTTTVGVDNYKMVPGTVLPKDPKVTVAENSEACYLFVKVTESATPNLSDYILYTIDDSVWTAGTGTEAGQNGVPIGVYFCEVDASTGAQEFRILGDGAYAGYVWSDNEVLVKPEITKEQMDTLTISGTTPTLKFTAYAVQKANIDDVATAWSQAQTLGV